MQLAINLASVLAAVLFVILGSAKVFYTKAYMADQQWVGHLHARVSFVRFVGILEIVGGLALALPAIVGIGEPYVPIIAAIILGGKQIVAVIITGRAADYRNAAIHAAYILLPAFLIFGYTLVGQTMTVKWV